MMKFKFGKEVLGERQVVEVWKDDVFVASIYPHEKSITVVSKFLKKVVVDEKYPPEANIEFEGI
jgi:hypothetical protein